MRWSGLLPNGLTALVSLGSKYELLAVEVVSSDAGLQQQDQPGLEETAAAKELWRAVARAAAGVPVGSAQACERLQRLTEVWQRSRRNTSLLRLAESDQTTAALLSSRPGPRLFAGRVGSHTVEVSWEPLGGVGLEAASYEAEVRRHRSLSSQLSSQRRGGVDQDLESLGSFHVPGGPTVRSFTLRRLQPIRWHRIRVRALGPERSWVSGWSSEVSVKTLSIEAAREAGLHVSADSFLVPSERRICAAANWLAEAGDESPARQAEAEVYDGYPVKSLLDARACQGGWPDFVRLGARYSRPPATRDVRLHRMKLVLAAQELYNPKYSEGNPWFLGPFYYEEAGRKGLEAETAEAARLGGA